MILYEGSIGVCLSKIYGINQHLHCMLDRLIGAMSCMNIIYVVSWMPCCCGGHGGGSAYF